MEAVNKIPIVPQLLDVVARTTGMGFVAIARITNDRWITCTTKDLISFGLKPGDELKVETTICHEVHREQKAIFIEHVKEDDHFCNHPTPKMYGFESYISVPIFTRDGNFFGTLCAIDPNPAKIKTPEIEGMFHLFADLISFHLSAQEEIKNTTALLEAEKENSLLREQFIPILGHDLKNPVATTRMSADVLLKMSDNDFVKRQAGVIKSTSFRMEALIENILDFAKGKLGEGIILEKEPQKENLEKILKQVISEVKTISPERKIEADLSVEKEVYCDCSRIGQLFSNLLENADKHGDKYRPIKISARVQDENFVLEVINEGKRISDHAKKILFQPFYRKEMEQEKKGLGLGLYIASEIARAHQGKIEVDSSDERTIFCYRMPLTPDLQPVIEQ